MQSFLKWLGTLIFGEVTKPAVPNSRIMNSHLRATQMHRRASNTEQPTRADSTANLRQESEVVGTCTGRIENAGPGKNVLVGYTQTNEAEDDIESLTLEEFDTSESGEAVAFDPYNTGRFDRSASWSKILRK